MRALVNLPESPRGEGHHQRGQPLRPGPAYYFVGAALTLALISPAPFFWAPPLWVIALMARKPVEDGRRKPEAAARPVTPARPLRLPSPPANDNPAIPASAANPQKAEILDV